MIGSPMGKKKKVKAEAAALTSPGRKYTVSIAIPGSIIENIQSFEHATYVAGQIARAAAIFCVDEVIVYDDNERQKGDTETVSSGAAFLARVVQFMETPQYLRRSLLPMHPDYRLAGTLPPLNAPHHLLATEWAQYREGVVLKSESDKGSYIDIGLDRTAFVQETLPKNTRVTLLVGDEPNAQFQPDYSETMIMGKVVSPEAPREEAGLYWGFRVRLALRTSAVFSECPYKAGYDLTVGTSEKGEKLASPADLVFSRYRHLLIMFGGLDGLEGAFSRDKALSKVEPAGHFSAYLNTCPSQGSRTIRTEEALLISLAFMQPAILRFGGPEPMVES